MKEEIEQIISSVEEEIENGKNKGDRLFWIQNSIFYLSFEKQCDRLKIIIENGKNDFFKKSFNLITIIKTSKKLFFKEKKIYLIKKA